MRLCKTYARVSRNIASASTKVTAPNFTSRNSIRTGLVRYIAGLSTRWRNRLSTSRPHHLRLGTRCEILSCRFLRKNGYKILFRNFRGRTGGEIDVVCRHRDTLVFVEVKTRTSEDFGRPLETIHRDQQNRIMRGGLAWLRLLGDPDI